MAQKVGQFEGTLQWSIVVCLLGSAGRLSTSGRESWCFSGRLLNEVDSTWVLGKHAFCIFMGEYAASSVVVVVEDFGDTAFFPILRYDAQVHF